MKEVILKLRSEGLSYSTIAKEVDCAKSTVAYYCGEGVREKAIDRSDIIRRKNKYKPPSLSTKIRSKIYSFSKGIAQVRKFNINEVYENIINNPECYLTGREIDLNDRSTWSLDHIIPRSKGGVLTKDNIGLSCRDANYAKYDMHLNDFIQLCKEVCENNGYQVTTK